MMQVDKLHDPRAGSVNLFKSCNDIARENIQS
jgi:hypothetical protein